ncbi:DUF2459 domain-containing protein [Roseococcus thiosulfatophilus]|uniref:DUF2459 domain-containing protein n=1 Tax=Roseococcus thiosulfatophilus TaxID=35813 RepID=UPI001A8C7433|nr:DUF2459 domain-containing protein [Roseococcus thiosulfatophilus]
MAGFARRSLLAAACLPGCASLHQPQVTSCALDPGGLPAWLVAISWHSDVALPRDALQGPVLGALAARLPGAHTVMFGFGKRSFITAPEPSLGEWLRGPLPGPAALQVTPLRAAPEQAVPGREIAPLPMAPATRARLAAFIAHAFAGEAPIPIRVDAIPHALFFEARETYTLENNCNAWTARALASAGLPFSPTGVTWPDAVMRHAAALGAACGLAPRNLASIGHRPG